MRHPAIVIYVALFASPVFASCAGTTRRSDPPPPLNTVSGSAPFDPHRQAPAPPVDGAVAGGTVTVLGRDSP